MIGGGAVSPNPGPSWQAIGTGDFNRDGYSDILFQNTSTGQVSIWEMHGTGMIGGGAVSANPGPSWHAIGTGDSGGGIRTSVSKHKRPNLDLGHERATHRRRRDRQRQSRAGLARGRAGLTASREFRGGIPWLPSILSQAGGPGRKLAATPGERRSRVDHAQQRPGAEGKRGSGDWPVWPREFTFWVTNSCVKQKPPLLSYVDEKLDRPPLAHRDDRRTWPRRAYRRGSGEDGVRSALGPFRKQLETRGERAGNGDFFSFLRAQPFEKSQIGEINGNKFEPFCLNLFPLASAKIALWLYPGIPPRALRPRRGTPARSLRPLGPRRLGRFRRSGPRRGWRRSSRRSLP